ncbi:N-6 DNA methylase [Streptococcus suis]|uniref:Eco57I restriction-modification methylase domain-containing protein n=1 Tax=Streptococcus suis TaxID=1307 RepID=UPI002AA37899|nr:N-6 DNA methylase [Streptococcus suis]
MEFLSTAKVAKKWNMSNRRVQFLAASNRIPGAMKVSGVWLIPEIAEKPTESRRVDVYHRTMQHRKKLKKLLKECYRNFGKDLPKEKFRAVLISAMNASLLNKLIPDYDYVELKNIIQEVYNQFNVSNSFFFEQNMQDKLYTMINEYTLEVGDDFFNILSWTYQYLNNLLFEEFDDLSKTQFFTEQYMIDFLISDLNFENNRGAIIDPCCGGGNMLTSIIDKYVASLSEFRLEQVPKVMHEIVGFDIDENLAIVATLNIKLKIINDLLNHGNSVNMDTWYSIKPQIYSTKSSSMFGSLDDSCLIYNVMDGTNIRIADFKKQFDVVITNPPFATVKGMNKEFNDFLRLNYPMSNSDVCVSFIKRAVDFLKNAGVVLMVVQNSWMFLNSFKDFREYFVRNLQLTEIVDLGSGAFADLTGEKASVSLLKYMVSNSSDSHQYRYLNLKNTSIVEKIDSILSFSASSIFLSQAEMLKNENYRFDFMNINSIKDFYYQSDKVAQFATPMQGTSTGDSKKLTGYFWEHFNDEDWLLVSKGGGYSRWKGLNRYVVKWGEDAKYIKEQKGSALRNVKYFNQTELVFSDTGTGGLNVRKLLENQIFIASGPGIRMIEGDSYALMGILNSRLATYYMKILSPKLTIAAGYIGNIPIKKNMLYSSLLSEYVRRCVDSKNVMLSIRPHNYEYNMPIKYNGTVDLDNVTSSLILLEIGEELKKLENEYLIEKHIFSEAEIQVNDIENIYNELGKPAMEVGASKSVSISEIDKLWDKITDDSGSLSKKRVGNALGIDGVLEYISLSLEINPTELFLLIKNNITYFIRVRKKYSNLILHNFIVDYFGFDTREGIKTEAESVRNVAQELSTTFALEIEDATQWIKNNFSKIHDAIFYGKPIFKIENQIKIRVR